MSFVKLRVLVTDYDQNATKFSSKNHKVDDEILNAAVGNIVSHSSSKVNIYVLFRDFKKITVVLQKFPAIIPVMVDPLSDIDNTRKILRLLPRMNHIVNLFGDHVARELAGKDDFFRIKAVSLDYIDSKKVIEKILESDDKQGIIFNISSDEAHQFGEKCKVEKVLTNLKNSFRDNKNKNIIMQPGDDQGSKACSSKVVHQSENSAPTRKSANNVSQESSVFDHCFPQFKTKTIIPSNPQNYAKDLDDRMKAALQHLHKKAVGKWKTKSEKLVKKDSDASEKVERKVEKWKQEELPNALAKIEKDNQRTLERSFDPELKEKIIKRRHDSANAEVEREGRKLMSQKRNTLEAKLSFSTVTLEQEHYQYIIRKQMNLLNKVWQGGSGVGRF